MAVLPIVLLGDPVLRQRAEPVSASELTSRAFGKLIDDMIDTMREAQGVGLAAPQVGVGLRLFVYESRRHEPPIPLTVVINPRISPLPGDLIFGWEGCLSIPDLKGLVPRHAALELAAFDRGGGPLAKRVEGFEARIIQHELDHLDGIVYLDRMTDLTSLGFVEVLDDEGD